MNKIDTSVILYYLTTPLITILSYGLVQCRAVCIASSPRQARVYICLLSSQELIVGCAVDVSVQIDFILLVAHRTHLRKRPGSRIVNCGEDALTQVEGGGALY